MHPTMGLLWVVLPRPLSGRYERAIAHRLCGCDNEQSQGASCDRSESRFIEIICLDYVRSKHHESTTKRSNPSRPAPPRSPVPRERRAFGSFHCFLTVSRTPQRPSSACRFTCVSRCTRSRSRGDADWVTGCLQDCRLSSFPVAIFRVTPPKRPRGRRLPWNLRYDMYTRCCFFKRDQETRR